MSFPLVKYVLIAALRDKLILSFFLILVVGACLSLFLGSSAVIEKEYFTVVFASGGLRIASVMALVLFVVFFVRRSFDSKDIEFLLSRPVGRMQFILSLSAGFSVLAVVIGIVLGVLVYALGPNLFKDSYFLWVASIIVENIIMVNSALFFSMYISSAASASMAVAGFYLLGRLIGQLLGMSSSDLVDGWGPVPMIMNVVSVIVPRFDLMGQASWLIYGYSGDVGYAIVFAQGAVFCFLVLCAAMLDFVRRQF